MPAVLGCPDREQKLAGGSLPLHRHRTGYVSLVLDGGYSECGSMGRWVVEPGQFVAHDNFECHRNMVARSGAWVLNMRIPAVTALPPVFTVRDPDAVIAAARSGVSVAPWLLPIRAVAPRDDDWYDTLAARLRRGTVSITARADEAGLAPATVCRGFKSAFGVTPARYRLEGQTLRAMRLIATTAEPLALVATTCGFADQAHMTRSVRALTGTTPGRWRRRSDRFNTG